MLQGSITVPVAWAVVAGVDTRRACGTGAGGVAWLSMRGAHAHSRSGQSPFPPHLGHVKFRKVGGAGVRGLRSRSGLGRIGSMRHDWRGRSAEVGSGRMGGAVAGYAKLSCPSDCGLGRAPLCPVAPDLDGQPLALHSGSPSEPTCLGAEPPELRHGLERQLADRPRQQATVPVLRSSMESRRSSAVQARSRGSADQQVSSWTGRGRRGCRGNA
jgi:hypothetical protein